MNYNSYIIIIGCIVILVAVFLIIKENRFQRNDSDKNTTQENYAIRVEVAKINNEVKQLSENIGLVLKSIDLEGNDKKYKTRKTDLEFGEDDDSFNSTLKYQMFEKKNEEVISLYKSNVTTEDIAKQLKKSYREVEMIIKLLK
ncbi:MAG: hypothetical protein LR001_01325 [Clostridiales bacterium]|nr:hypothetical protein [Clostridiales bacterium]